MQPRDGSSVFSVYTLSYNNGETQVALLQSTSILGIYDFTTCYRDSSELATKGFGLWTCTSFVLSQNVLVDPSLEQEAFFSPVTQYPILYQHEQYSLLRNLILSQELNLTMNLGFITWLLMRSQQEIELLDRIRKHNENACPGMKKLVK